MTAPVVSVKMEGRGFRGVVAMAPDRSSGEVAIPLTALRDSGHRDNSGFHLVSAPLGLKQFLLTSLAAAIMSRWRKGSQLLGPHAVYHLSRKTKTKITNIKVGPQ